ncbi:MarR family winged helix-turn-helix transcriptional regulator [Thermobifida cellulosilytica]|uniref:Regulatory protein MarR n=1 Tax=Thermobifida cellulosilytica TB100 TaxID=665004 RepID=A0A147KEW7_THECS|nr:MarR family transcriptional regulator [Thermobifida cellulosilytica]KUP95833.1 regulatory protein MarR [Thermobifida cellulosilytica TB100]
MDSDTSDAKCELIERLRDLEVRQLRLFVRDRSLPLLSTTLTIQQLKVLVALAVDGNTPTHELAERIGVSVATLTGIVDRLSARSLVLRREDPADRRVRRVDLTEKGRALIDDMWGTSRERTLAALRSLDVETLRGLVRGVEAVYQALLDSSRTAPARAEER